MQFTNKFGLPQGLVDRLADMPRKPEERLIHVTEGVDSPRPRRLKMEHWDNLEEDVSKRLFALYGQIGHR